MPPESASSDAVSNPVRSRRGRPPSGAREQRRAEVLDAAFAELAERGADGVTMASIARRAGASKETLYSWFDNRSGLFRAMIASNADAAAARIAGALADPDQPESTLREFGLGLLGLLTDPQSIALNRAAMSDPELAADLLASGRHRVGPIVDAYLDRCAARDRIRLSSAADGFELFYGLLVRDTQIRTLLGESPPDGTALTRRASEAAAQYMMIVGAS
ncbi:MAG: TetR/AcrR family transcriptional regulator [Ilumatobacter sp.]